MVQEKKCASDHKGFIGFLLSWKGIVLVLALAGISFYLLTVHLEHIAVALPYLVLLACPLMHIFGHGHGRHEDGKSNTK